ncbi:MAG: hypothetical protein IJZ10_00315, partial [Thermoguttaceae bacterium]|nr:hypothetical protein [Thermoguttaceae bacterium]
EMELGAALDKIKQATRNFAKRQETWFRSLTASGARRVAVDGRERADIRDEIVAAIRATLDENAERGKN